MIVVCEHCSSKYRINEGKLPTGGGNIKCPQCQGVFFVAPPGQAPPGPSLPMRPGGAVDYDDSKTMVGTVPAALLAGGGFSGASEDMESKTMIGAPPAFLAAAAAAAAAAAKEAAEKEAAENPSWKLKTNFGLIYEFPDTDSLQSWLSARDNLVGYKLSNDGKNFRELDTFPEVSAIELGQKSNSRGGSSSPRSAPQRSAPARSEPPRQQSSPQRQGPDQPSPEPVFVPASNNYSKPNRPRSSRSQPGMPVQSNSKSSTMILASLALLLVLGAVGLQISGVVDFRGNIAKKRAEAKQASKAGYKAIETPVTPVEDENTGSDDEDEYEDDGEDVVFEGEDDQPFQRPDPTKVAVNPLSHKGHIQTLLQKADEEMSSGEYKKAVATLNMAKGLDPKNVGVYRRFEDVYERMGNDSAYEDARAKRKALEQ